MRELQQSEGPGYVTLQAMRASSSPGWLEVRYINMLDTETGHSMRCRCCNRLNLEVDSGGLIHCPSDHCRTVHVVEYRNPRTRTSGRVLGYQTPMQGMR